MLEPPTNNPKEIDHDCGCERPEWYTWECMGECLCHPYDAKPECEFEEGVDMTEVEIEARKITRILEKKNENNANRNG